MNNQNYGQLLQPSIKLHRQYFREMVKLLGINVIYRAPKENKKWTTYAELDTNYEPPILVGCIFDAHPTQQTLKKMGWVAELQQDASIIHVDYDLPRLQQGSLFIVPSSIECTEGRLFRVVRLTTSMVYPASIVCEIVPEYYDLYVPDQNTYLNNSNINVLNDEEPIYDVARFNEC